MEFNITYLGKIRKSNLITRYTRLFIIHLWLVKWNIVMQSGKIRKAYQMMNIKFSCRWNIKTSEIIYISCILKSLNYIEKGIWKVKIKFIDRPKFLKSYQTTEYPRSTLWIQFINYVLNRKIEKVPQGKYKNFILEKFLLAYLVDCGNIVVTKVMASCRW